MSHQIATAARKTRRLQGAMAATLIAAAALLAQAPGRAEEKPWNEAVTIDKDGKRRVILNKVDRGIPQKAPKTWEPPTPLTTWVIEGPDGLVECVQKVYKADGTCNPYHPGQYSTKRFRSWVVLRGGKWWDCAKPETRNMCTKSTECSGDPKDKNRCYPLTSSSPSRTGSSSIPQL